MNNMIKTLEYYNENALNFVTSTKNVDFHTIQLRFIRKLSQGAAILDFGSILHLPYHELKEVFLKMACALKENGIVYTSFKYGIFEGERNGRYFTDMTEEKMEKLLQEVSVFHTEELWISEDVRPGREDEKWLNIILRKN
ncbi:MAG: SAM-dependent methyltransferase [Lachnospiraceae bacterium]|nr:SAM-dependent methyltransferase [Lachnospiraceae bacterium]